MWHTVCVGWSWTHHCRLGPSRQVERMRDQMTIPVQTCPNSPQHPSVHSANVAKKSLFCTFIHLLNTHFEGLKQIEIIQELIESHQHQCLTMRNWNSHPPWESFCHPGQHQVGAQPHVHSGGHPTNRDKRVHTSRHLRDACWQDTQTLPFRFLFLPELCGAVGLLMEPPGWMFYSRDLPGDIFHLFWLISVQEYINIHGLEIFY